MAHCTPFPQKSFVRTVQEKDPGNGTQCAIVPYNFWFCFLDTMDTISGFSTKVLHENCKKKDPGNRENGVHGARATKINVLISL